MAVPGDEFNDPGPEGVIRRFSLPPVPPPVADGSLRHSHGYARPIAPASIGRVRIAAMASEVRAHLVDQCAKRFGDPDLVSDSEGTICIKLTDQTLFVVVQDVAPAVTAIRGSVERLLHSSESAREKAGGSPVVLVIVGVVRGESEAEAGIADLKKRYHVTFRYVTYQLGSDSFWI